VISTVKANSLRVIDWKDDKACLVPIDFSLGAEAQQVLKSILGVDSRPSELEIVQNLHRYQEMVVSNAWDTEEGKLLRDKLEAWDGEYKPELLRLDMDIRMKSLDLNR